MKDFIEVSFKGRISTAPSFEMTKEGALRAYMNVAVNKDYKNNGEPFFITVSFLGKDAEYVQKGYQDGKGSNFQVGSTLFVYNAQLGVKQVKYTDEEGKTRTRYELGSALAKTDRVICLEKKGKQSTQPAYGMDSAAQNPSWGQWQPQQASQPYYGQGYQQQWQQAYQPQQPFNYAPNGANSYQQDVAKMYQNWPQGQQAY